MHLPVIPETAPFNAEQRMWLNGYLAGIFSGTNHGTAIPTTGEAAVDRGSILFAFGTQTGGSETLARKFAKDAKKQGFTTSVVGMDSFADIDFSKESRLALITSTYGDGEMPDNAQAFWEHLAGASAPTLSHLEFSVLALGDTNYPLFCEAGKKFDARLAELGAKRVLDRVDCDIDFDVAAVGWFSGLISKWSDSPDSIEAVPESVEGYGKANPYPAQMKSCRLINRDGSTKETLHVSFSIDGPGMAYEAGDALGVIPRNCPQFVDEILRSAGLDGNEVIPAPAGGSVGLREALAGHYDLKPFLTKMPSAVAGAMDLVQPLKKLQPRLYSIASSPKAHGGEVHLTVGVVRYEQDGKPVKGVCSTYFAEFESRAVETKMLPVFIHRSPHFRLPADSSKPVIMVGPGTGIAPFRAFLHERRATAATGKNWLFFGDQKRAVDFLYEEELSSMLADGHLTRLDLAFSRDQEQKTYVQHRMVENAVELWDWFQNGAYFYVCGDAKRMAKDVEAALLDVARIASGCSEEVAAGWLASLKKEKRYLRDVY